jgi:hypothetical protein
VGDTTGSFELNGIQFNYEIMEIHTFDGEEYQGSDIENHVEEADRVFYNVKDPEGETYYRWIGGPFEDLSQIADAIQDDSDVYEGSSA